VLAVESQIQTDLVAGWH